MAPDPTQNLKHFNHSRPAEHRDTQVWMRQLQLSVCKVNVHRFLKTQKNQMRYLVFGSLGGCFLQMVCTFSTR